MPPSEGFTPVAHVQYVEEGEVNKKLLLIALLFVAEAEVGKGFGSTTDPLPSAETPLMPLPVHF